MTQPEFAKAVRIFSRLGLRAYAWGHVVVISTSEKRVVGELISLSNYGARIKAPGQGFQLGERVDINLKIPARDLEAGRFPCRVTWVQDNELDVAFPVLMSLTMGEAQQFLDG